MPPFVSTVVHFPAPGGATAPLVGTLHAPTPPPLPPATPTAVLCHGLADHRDTRLLTALASGLETAGIASLRFDFGGNGDSAAVRPFKFGNCREEAGDVRAAVAAVADWGGRVVATAGHSKGGSSVILAGEAAPCVVNIAGRFDHTPRSALVTRFGEETLAAVQQADEEGVPIVWRLAGQPTEWRLTQADIEDRVTTNMAAAAAALPPTTRVLHIHGADDAVVPPSAAASYADATRHCAESRLVYIEGGDHNFTNDAHLSQLVDAVVAFVVAGLSER